VCAATGTAPLAGPQNACFAGVDALQVRVCSGVHYSATHCEAHACKTDRGWMLCINRPAGADVNPFKQDTSDAEIQNKDYYILLLLLLYIIIDISGRWCFIFLFLHLPS
jgi:hypothetical protein